MVKKNDVEITTPIAEVDGAFAWDSSFAVTADRVSKLLAEGPAKFETVDFTRGRFAGSEKMSACPRADLVLNCKDREGNVAEVPVGLPLHERMMWKLCQYAKSTGLIDASLDEGEAFTMPWDQVIGSKGVCEIETRTWVGNDGTKHQSNNVKRFIYGDEALSADIDG